MLSKLFSTAVKLALPSSQRSASIYPYQPLSQDDDGENPNDGERPYEPSQVSDAQPKVHRDAAAMMLIKLGRSPDEIITVSPADDARILRRIDIALLPLMLSVYFLQALDKATLSYASIFGLIDDTDLVGDEFSWLGSIVYLAQLIMQLPLAWALVKLPIGKFTSAMVLAWGITLAGMTWAHTFGQLMAARFFLGAFEACVGPAFVAITQMWWRRREQTMRIGSWYCMNGLTWVFGSLITYGLASIDSSMKPYQIIFLFFGVLTVAVSGAMFFWMPDSPTEAKFLSDEDKILAIERLRNNQMGVMSREWRYAHFFETLQDPKTWLWVVMIFCISVPSNGVSTFGPLIIKSFVTDPYRTILFNVPVGLSHVLAVSLSITPLIYSWSAQNTAGDTKRKCTSALVFIGSSAGNIVGPLLFTPDEAPSYSRGLRANIVFFVMVILFVGITSLYLRYLNSDHAKRRVALGKNAVILDMSLETAEEVERMESLEQAMREGTQRLSEENGDTRLGGDEENGVQPDDLKGRKAFADITDLENEDFVFVF
ncbi:hypothetical protein TrVFT333_004195 [Trichoderma virens FT-333]|nr:hypothetical protein TrVFT333_004195 [Trichoderma virens FT-333]